MKKKVIIVIIVLVLLILLFPIRNKSNEGVIWEYESLVYKVSKVKKLVSTEEIEGERIVEEYNHGIIVEIFSFEIYNNVK